MNNKRRRVRKKKKIFLKKKIEFFNENKGIKIFCITLIAMISFYIIYSNYFISLCLSKKI